MPASDSHAPEAWVEHNEIASRLAHESTVLLQNKKPKKSAAKIQSQDQHESVAEAALPADPKVHFPCVCLSRARLGKSCRVSSTKDT